ncbi:hypothetical protein CCP2SC5_30081 [Azospirillaceae bacterium]
MLYHISTKGLQSDLVVSVEKETCGVVDIEKETVLRIEKRHWFWQGWLFQRIILFNGLARFFQDSDLEWMLCVLMDVVKRSRISKK